MPTVADDGVPFGGSVDPNLMRPAGFQSGFQERHSAAGGQAFEVRGGGFAGNGSGPRPRSSWIAHHHQLVSAFNGVGLKRIRDGFVGPTIQSEQNQSAGWRIEPMMQPNVRVLSAQDAVQVRSGAFLCGLSGQSMGFVDNQHTRVLMAGRDDHVGIASDRRTDFHSGPSRHMMAGEFGAFAIDANAAGFDEFGCSFSAQGCVVGNDFVEAAVCVGSESMSHGSVGDLPGCDPTVMNSPIIQAFCVASGQQRSRRFAVGGF